MEEDETETEDDTMVDNPSIDRGWAWMVVLGSLVINIIYDGCSYSFGIFFTNFLKYFGDTRSHTAWIGSLFFSVPLLCGPIARFVTKKIGFRKSTMIGGLIASVGFSCGAFSNSVTVLCITYGIISGFGMSLPYFNSIVVEAVYFKKRRALATGIAESGAGIGTVIFAPLTNYLISVYGWRGALLIIGGIVANIIVCGSLFRPIMTRLKDTEKETSGDEASIKEDEVNYETAKLKSKESETAIAEPGIGYTELSHRNSKCSQTKLENDLELYQANGGNNISQLDEANVNLLNKHVIDDSIALVGNQPKTCLSIRLSELQVKSSIPTDRVKSKYNIFLHIIFEYVANKDILRNKGFILFSLSNFVMYFWYDVPYVFLVDKAIYMKISDTNATFLVSIIGIVHTIGNIGYGILGDRDKISKTFMYGVSIILCGISVAIIPQFKTYVPLAILAGLFGLFSAANEAMCSIIIIEVVGLKNLDQAYGVIMMLQGIANLVGPPVAGWLCDVTGEYDATFYTAGACIIAAGLVYLLLPLWKRKAGADQDENV